jgi:hypothetical protein
MAMFRTEHEARQHWSADNIVPEQCECCLRWSAPTDEAQDGEIIGAWRTADGDSLFDCCCEECANMQNSG